MARCKKTIDRSGNYAIELGEMKKGTKYVLSFTADCYECVFNNKEFWFSHIDEGFPEVATIILLPLTANMSKSRISVEFATNIYFKEVGLYSQIKINASSGQFYIYDIKVEIGKKATPYIPNPLDITRVIDYPSLVEQKVPNEFWVVGGKQKEIYKRTFIFSTIVRSDNFNFLNRLNLGISSIISIKGSWGGTFKVDNLYRESTINSDQILLYGGILKGYIDISPPIFKESELLIDSIFTIVVNIEYTK